MRKKRCEIHFDGLNKSCSKCKEIKKVEDFHKNKSHRLGYDDYCKKCVSLRRSKTFRFFDGLNKSCPKCKEIYPVINFLKSKYTKNGYQSWCKKCFYKHVEDSAKNNIQHRIHRNIYSQLKKHINKRGLIKENKLENYISMDMSSLKKHIEDNFREGMSWDNWGEVWELHHILPKSYFGNDVEDIYKCWNFNNLIPLYKTTEIALSFGDNTLGNRNIKNTIIYDPRKIQPRTTYT